MLFLEKEASGKGRFAIEAAPFESALDQL